VKGKSGKPVRPKDEGNWTGRSFRYSVENGKLIETQISGFTFTATQEKEIRRAFPRGFPDHGKSAFLRRMAGALAKLAADKGEPATDPRAARDRADKVAALLTEAASEIGKMTEAERDVFDLAVSGDPVALGGIRAALEKAATGFRKAADGHALGRGEKVAGPDAKALAVAAQAAVAWREVFKREPSADPASSFTAVLDKLLDALGGEKAPRPGKDAIRSAIKGPPKSRKSR